MVTSRDLSESTGVIESDLPVCMSSTTISQSTDAARVRCVNEGGAVEQQPPTMAVATVSHILSESTGEELGDLAADEVLLDEAGPRNETSHALVLQ